MKTAKALIGIMSPTTLAGLIADIQLLGKDADGDEREIERWAMQTLAANVGDLEAKAMVAELAG